MSRDKSVKNRGNTVSNRGNISKNRTGILLSPLFQCVEYSLLLIFTPFIMLKGYLQTAIGEISEFKVTIAGAELPLVFSIVLVGFLVVLFLIRHLITVRRLLAALFCLGLVLLGQYISDFYMDNPFYDLQNNWHYIAYSIYAIVIYRFLSTTKLNKKIFPTLIYFGSLTLSLIDEGFQYFISSRVFDLGDVAKDGWGSVIGLIFIYYLINESRQFGLVPKKIRAIFDTPERQLFLALCFNFIFLNVSSLLTDLAYARYVFLISVALCILFIILLPRRKWMLISEAVLLSVLILAGAFSYTTADKKVTFIGDIPVYRGIPILFFDVMIFPDNSFRLVDKKAFFGSGDKKFIFSHKPEILIVAKGETGSGGKGFSTFDVHLAHNPTTHKATQVVVKNNREAAELFNRYREMGWPGVMMVIHQEI